MAITSTLQLEPGAALPAFHLTDVVSGAAVSSDDFAGQPLLVVFMCAHCPYVVHTEHEIARVASDYADRIATVGIASNDPGRVGADGPDGLREQAQRVGFAFPYLFDESQDVARAFAAACTPDFFLFDANHRLHYRGRLDASRPNSDTPLTGVDLRAAIDGMLAGAEPPADQHPSMGCGIKWRAGTDPVG